MPLFQTFESDYELLGKSYVQSSLRNLRPSSAFITGADSMFLRALLIAFANLIRIFEFLKPFPTAQTHFQSNRL